MTVCEGGWGAAGKVWMREMWWGIVLWESWSSIKGMMGPWIVRQGEHQGFGGLMWSGETSGECESIDDNG